MQTIKMVSGARAYLTAKGFVISSSNTRKVAGLQQDWIHADGRTAKVGYGLLSSTGQSSRGAGAVWGWVLWISKQGAAA